MSPGMVRFLVIAIVIALLGWGASRVDWDRFSMNNKNAVETFVIGALIGAFILGCFGPCDVAEPFVWHP